MDWNAVHSAEASWHTSQSGLCSFDLNDAFSSKLNKKATFS
jgi:hypothetical protein